MVRSFNTRSLGAVVIGVSRSMLAVHTTALGTVMVSRNDSGWKFLRISGSIPVKAPLWVAVIVKAIRLHTPRARHWALLGADIDCDGTTYHANRVTAWTLAGAEAQADQYTYDVISERVFRRRYPDAADEYWFEHGYTSLGADWKPWVYDDTIGIPALDSRYDEPVL